MDFGLLNVGHGVQTGLDRREVSIEPSSIHIEWTRTHSITATHQNLSPFRQGYKFTLRRCDDRGSIFMDFGVSNVRHGVQTRLDDRREVSIEPSFLHIE